MDFVFSDNTPIAALTLGQFKSILPSIISRCFPQFPKGDNTKEILTKTECAELTGFSINTINKYVSEKKIPHYKKGARVLFRQDEITEWLLSHKVQTIEEFCNSKDEELLNRKGNLK